MPLKLQKTTMGFKCCVPECRTGYDGPPGASNLSMHMFPSKEPDLRQQWIRNIHRDDQEPTLNHRVCSLHFRDNDFQIDSKDKKINRKERPNDGLKKRVLLPDAVPSIFPDLPKYFNIDVPEQRSESTSKEARFKRQNDAYKLKSQEFLDADKIASFQELIEKLESELPKNITKLVTQKKTDTLCSERR